MSQVRNRPTRPNRVKTNPPGAISRAGREAKPVSLVGPELRQLLLPLLRWWWALLIVPLISGAIAFYVVQQGAAYYQGRMLLGVGPPVKEVQADIPELIVLRLTASYKDFVASDRFIELVAQQAHSHLDMDSLHRGIVTSALKGTPYFEVQFVDTDSTEVLNILRAIRDLLMSESPQVRQLRTKFQQDFLTERKIELQALIQARNQELSQLTNQLPPPGNPDTTNQDLRNSSTVREELDSYKQELNELNQLTGTNEANQLQVVEEPHLLSIKLGAQPRDGAIAMGTISLALVFGFIFLIEKFDPKVRHYNQIQQLLGQNILLVNRRSQKQSQPYQLLAAELVVAAVDRHVPAKFRLLCLYENWTAGMEPALSNLEQALGSLGMICTIRTGQPNGVLDPAEPDDDYPNRETGLVSRDQLYVKNPVEWDLISQNWPASLQQVSNLIQQCDSVLIFCSLNKSYIQSLVKLRSFLDTVPINVAGVVII
jgi:hypothetical protein